MPSRRIPEHGCVAKDSLRATLDKREPLLEDLYDINLADSVGLLVGGESGSGEEYLWDSKADWKKTLKHTEGRRTMKLEWAERMRDITKAAGLPFMFKQVTSPRSGVGVNALGQIWHEFPEAPYGLFWKPRAEIEPETHSPWCKFKK